jgi:hypothetical protein
MSTRDRIKKLFDKWYDAGKPKAGIVRVCMTEDDERNAQEEFEKLPPDIPKMLIVQKDMSLPRPEIKND